MNSVHAQAVEKARLALDISAAVCYTMEGFCPWVGVKQNRV